MKLLNAGTNPDGTQRQIMLPIYFAKFLLLDDNLTIVDGFNTREEVWDAIKEKPYGIYTFLKSKSYCTEHLDPDLEP